MVLPNLPHWLSTDFRWTQSRLVSPAVHRGAPGVAVSKCTTRQCDRNVVPLLDAIRNMELYAYMRVCINCPRCRSVIGLDTFDILWKDNVDYGWSGCERGCRCAGGFSDGYDIYDAHS